MLLAHVLVEEGLGPIDPGAQRTSVGLVGRRSLRALARQFRANNEAIGVHDAAHVLDEVLQRTGR